MATITSTNPYTGETNATFETINDAQLTTLIEQAHTAYLSWKNMPKAEKKALFLRLADLLDERAHDYWLLETREMGALLTATTAWKKSTAELVRRNADNFETVLGNESFETEGLTWHIQYDPIGVIYGIAPWNFPFNQLLRAAIPNLLAGNTVVYKHASNVPMCAKAIQELFDNAWFPAGVYTNLFITASQSELVIAHPAVQGVNLTWSETAGSAVGALAGKYLKRSVLELGGNDAFVVLDHADTDAVVALATSCRIHTAGQRCNSSKRFIVPEKYYEDFVEKMGKSFEALSIGDPLDPRTQLGPLSTKKLMNDIHDQVTRTISEGARLITGGTILNESRTLYAPTVLADVTPEMMSYREEVFGPVASIIKAKDIEEAIALANNNDFWLSAVVAGDDHQQMKAVAARLEGWMIFINQSAGSKASLPFGGVKKSGYGKENGPDGLKSFTNRKVVIY
jgi:succinate-semialdehyde dehydrogenase/glutarate-semialdehyde dehydrogenase